MDRGVGEFKELYWVILHMKGHGQSSTTHLLTFSVQCPTALQWPHKFLQTHSLHNYILKSHVSTAFTAKDFSQFCSNHNASRSWVKGQTSGCCNKTRLTSACIKSRLKLASLIKPGWRELVVIKHQHFSVAFVLLGELHSLECSCLL